LTQRFKSEECLISINQALSFLPAIELDNDAIVRLACGGRAVWPDEYPSSLKTKGSEHNIIRVLTTNAELIALARVIENEQDEKKQRQLQPIRVLANALRFADKYRESRGVSGRKL